VVKHDFNIHLTDIIHLENNSIFHIVHSLVLEHFKLRFWQGLLRKTNFIRRLRFSVTPLLAEPVPILHSLSYMQYMV
jgi:hypothetical protein